MGNSGCCRRRDPEPDVTPFADGESSKAAGVRDLEQDAIQQQQRQSRTSDNGGSCNGEGSGKNNGDSMARNRPSYKGSRVLNMSKGLSYDLEMSQTGALGQPFPKRPMGCKLSQQVWDKMEQLFRKMDPDGSNAVTRDEAKAFFKCAFGQISVDAMFNEVDTDNSGAIDSKEFVSFWVHVRKTGYKEKDIIEELDELLNGGAWVDWNDGRDTAPMKKDVFPRRPILCRISQTCWDKCLDVFRLIDNNGSMTITREKALAHFKCSFAICSVNAMFNEIDQNHHGHITPKEWMKFWVQVKGSGYKEDDIMAELEQLAEGSTWVDWKDGRKVAGRSPSA